MRNTQIKVYTPLSWVNLAPKYFYLPFQFSRQSFLTHQGLSFLQLHTNRIIIGLLFNLHLSKWGDLCGANCPHIWEEIYQLCFATYLLKVLLGTSEKNMCLSLHFSFCRLFVQTYFLYVGQIVLSPSHIYSQGYNFLGHDVPFIYNF